MKNLIYPTRRLLLALAPLWLLALPPTLRAQCWSKVVAGDGYSAGIKTDGSLWMWGVNSFGQLGNGSTATTILPVRVGTANNWAEVSIANGHTLALTTDGTLYAWGDNTNGALGTGNNTSITNPVQIGAASEWKAICAGVTFSNAIKKNGTLWTWGYNGSGNLGIGNTTDTNFPVQVGTDNTWGEIATAVGSGGLTSLALKTNGTLWVWGYRGYLYDDGSGMDSYVPIQVGTETNWSKISGGTEHILALKANGTLWAWGSNYSGCLGNGTTTSSVTPTQVGTDNTWSQISAGYNFSFARKINGTLWGWGTNSAGQLGIGNTTDQYLPVQIGSGGNWQWISAGGEHTLALQGGQLWSWGENFLGALGNGASIQTSPIQVGTNSNWIAIGAGHRHSLALSSNGSLLGWGYNYQGQVGNGSTQDVLSPVALPGTWNRISALRYHNLGIQPNGSLWAWGSNSYGALGNGSSSGIVTSPVQVGASYAWAKLSKGYANQFSSALQNNGSLWAWGLNTSGQLGNGSNTNASVPVQVGSDTDWQAVAMGMAHMLALKNNGSLWAWGSNVYGELGNNSFTASNIPLQVGTGHTWLAVAAGFYHSLALRSDGTLWAWGYNLYGKLGNGSLMDSPTPVQVGSDNDWTAIDAGGFHSLGIKANGTLWAWGFNGLGQLGTTPSLADSPIPMQVGSDTDWQSVSGGWQHTLALKTNGTLWIWGTRRNGIMGDGQTTLQTTPMAFPAPQAAFSAVVSGNTVVLQNAATNANLYSWDLGNGQTSTDPNPVATYAAAGTYTVCLTASNACGSQQSCQQVTVGAPVNTDTTRVPQLVNFQAVARDAQGNILGSTPIQIRLTVRQGGATGTALYCALHQEVTNSFGSFSIQLNANVLGQACNGAPLTAFEDIAWEDGSVWIGVEYQAGPGQAFVDLGAIELTSTFYAFVARRAENLKTASDVYITSPNQGVILKSPNGNCYRMALTASGALITVSVPCPQ